MNNQPYLRKASPVGNRKKSLAWASSIFYEITVYNVILCEITLYNVIFCEITVYRYNVKISRQWYSTLAALTFGCFDAPVWCLMYPGSKLIKSFDFEHLCKVMREVSSLSDILLNFDHVSATLTHCTKHIKFSKYLPTKKEIKEQNTKRLSKIMTMIVICAVNLFNIRKCLLS